MSIATNIAEPVPYRTQTETIPDYLLKEEIEGIKFYYKGYQQVLNKTKKPEDIMGCSSLQSFIIEYFHTILILANTHKRYRIFTNESGNHFAHRSNMQFDIALYDKTVLTGDRITRQYVQGFPPTLVVEIDLDVELRGTGLKNSEEFLKFRTKNLLKYGVQRVLWVLTKPKKILIAEGETWQFENWDKDIELIEGVTFNIAKYLKDEGVNPDL